MDEIIKISKYKANKLVIEYRNFKRVKISSGVFVDDLVVIAGAEKKVQKNLNISKRIMEEEGMEINTNITKFIDIFTPEEEEKEDQDKDENEDEDVDEDEDQDEEKEEE
ncbi:hypothetical protein FQA39_LY10100 [Lamprigera yunnana]|nr:hypothetical protein FQA39_LY10100 [Lamprigera yunnana]